MSEAGRSAEEQDAKEFFDDIERRARENQGRLPDLQRNRLEAQDVQISRSLYVLPPEPKE